MKALIIIVKNQEENGENMTNETKTADPFMSEEKENHGAIQQIVDMGSTVTETSHGNIHCLTIIGQIEGHTLADQNTKTTKYEHVMPLLVSLEESREISGVLFLLNTVGGDVEAGLGIAELIAGMSKPTVSLVLGGSHSIGVPLAVAAKTSFAVPSAAMTIHPVRMSGTMIAAPQTYHYFDQLQERIVSFVVKNSHIGKKKFLELMMKTGEMATDVGSVIYGQEAVALGLIDHVGGLREALADLYAQIDQNGEESR
jgi:ATP-dependent protease ClpP protease subunit